MKIRIERTKRGYPAFWESGGSYSKTGEAFIIAGKDGQPKKAIYVRRRGQLALCSHALIPIEVGDHIIYAKHHRKDFEIEICKIMDFEEETAVVEQVYEFSLGEWNDKNIERVFSAWEAGDLRSIDDIDDEVYFLCRAILAAMEKATCYHCREPHYIDE